jgi:hypothetical protein
MRKKLAFSQIVWQLETLSDFHKIFFPSDLRQLQIGLKERPDVAMIPGIDTNALVPTSVHISTDFSLESMSIIKKYSLRRLYFSFHLKGWQIHGVHRVQCTPSVLHQQSQRQPKSLFSSNHHRSADYSQAHSDNFGNFLRELN